MKQITHNDINSILVYLIIFGIFIIGVEVGLLIEINSRPVCEGITCTENGICVLDSHTVK